MEATELREKTHTKFYVFCLSFLGSLSIFFVQNITISKYYEISSCNNEISTLTSGRSFRSGIIFLLFFYILHLKFWIFKRLPNSAYCISYNFVYLKKNNWNILFQNYMISSLLVARPLRPLPPPPRLSGQWELFSSFFFFVLK